MTEQHTRDIPAPKYEVLREDANVETEDLSHREWHVKTHHSHMIRVLPDLKDDKMIPAKYGETNYVTVSVTEKKLPNGKVYRETAVTATDEHGTFYNAPMYVVPRALELFEVMFAIGEV